MTVIHRNYRTFFWQRTSCAMVRMLVSEHSSYQFLAASSNVETELLTAVNDQHQAERVRLLCKT
jgi:hypothetical protein